jgi:hypothetical protein
MRLRSETTRLRMPPSAAACPSLAATACLDGAEEGGAAWAALPFVNAPWEESRALLLGLRFLCFLLDTALGVFLLSRQFHLLTCHI